MVAQVGVCRSRATKWGGSLYTRKSLRTLLNCRVMHMYLYIHHACMYAMLHVHVYTCIPIKAYGLHMSLHLHVPYAIAIQSWESRGGCIHGTLPTLYSASVYMLLVDLPIPPSHLTVPSPEPPCMEGIVSISGKSSPITGGAFRSSRGSDAATNPFPDFPRASLLPLLLEDFLVVVFVGFLREDGG